MNRSNEAVKQFSNRKVALVHDFLVSYGGAERVFEAMAGMYPEAPIYTLLADPALVAAHFPGRDVRASWLSRLPGFLKRRYRFFLPFFPAAAESIDLRDFDLVLSSSGAWSKGIVTRLDTTHIAYLHSPMRYAWDYHEQYLAELKSAGRLKIFTRLLLSSLRVWDRQAAERPDFLLSNSRYTDRRIRKYYRRESQVISPGALDLFERTESLWRAEPEPERTHFLLVSRLTRSKKADLAVEAFNKLALPLVVVGAGPEREALRRQAGANIRFVGFVDDAALVRLYRSARALIFPSEEDFGMTAVEALSFGTPVIGYDYGGIREIVEPGVTGELFSAQTPEVLAEGVRRFLAREGQYDRERLRQSVAHFTTARFREELAEFIEKHR